MYKFIRTTTYKIPNDRSYANYLAALVHDNYKVARSNGFLVKVKTSDYETVEESFLYNLLHTNFDMYAYLTYTDWVADSALAVFPQILDFKHQDTNYEQYENAFHCVLTGSDDVSQQSLTVFAEVILEGCKYLIVTTAHTPLVIAVGKDRLLNTTPNSYSAIDLILRNNVPFLKNLIPTQIITNTIETVDLSSKEIQYKLLENILIYDDTHNKSRIYQEVVKIFPRTVISDISSFDESSNLEAYDIYRVTEEDLRDSHDDIPEEDIVIALSDSENIEDFDETDFLYQEVGIKVYNSEAGDNNLFHRLNAITFDNTVVSTQSINHDVQTNLQLYKQELLQNTIKIGDMLIDVQRLPTWRIFLLIPFIRGLMANNINLDDPEIDILEEFLTYVANFQYKELLATR